MSSKYNPWEDKQTFLQDVGSLGHFVDFADKQIIDNKETDDNDTKKDLCLSGNSIKEFETSNLVIELLEEVDKLSTLQYQKLEQLDVLYGKYKYQLLLSQNNNNELISKINELVEIFQIFEKNKIKIVNLIHNAGMTDANVIKIKHNDKINLIKTLKICTNSSSSVLELIELNENIHQETINKLKDKIKDVENKTNKLMNEYQSKYGPLVINSDATNKMPWSWDDRPWPWEN